MKSLLYILYKNLSFIILYLLIVKFNLTGETDSEFMKSNFSQAKELTFLKTLGISLYLNIIPIILDTILYFLIVKFLLIPDSKSKRTLFLRGILFHIPVILFWLFFVKIHISLATIMAIIFSFPISGFLYQKLKN